MRSRPRKAPAADGGRPRTLFRGVVRAALAAGLLALAAACDKVEAGGERGVVFHDDFNAENGMVSRANYDRFAQWEVVSGTADLIGTYPFEPLPPGHGMYVDLDGATGHGATFRTRRELALAPGVYVLSYTLAGSQRVSEPNTVHVTLGPVYAESFTLPSTAPARRVVRRIRVRRLLAARIQFVQDGGDNFGLLLDDVELVRAPRGTEE
jgi:hypothetical protein